MTKAERPLTDEEKEALGRMHRQNGVVVQRQGVAIKVAESLAERGYAFPVERLGKRNWYTELTDTGKAVAGEYEYFFAPEKVDPKKATSAVAEELFKRHPQYGLQSVYESIDCTTYTHFVDSVRAWVRDKSELRSSVIDAADYRELYVDFSGYQDAKPVFDEEPNDNG